MRSQSWTTAEDPDGTGPGAAAADMPGIRARIATTTITHSLERDLVISALLSRRVSGVRFYRSRRISSPCRREARSIEIGLFLPLPVRLRPRMLVNRFGLTGMHDRGTPLWDACAAALDADIVNTQAAATAGRAIGPAGHPPRATITWSGRAVWNSRVTSAPCTSWRVIASGPLRQSGGAG